MFDEKMLYSNAEMWTQTHFTFSLLNYSCSKLTEVSLLVWDIFTFQSS